MASLTLNSVEKDAGGRVYFRFASAEGQEEWEFPSRAAAADFARDTLDRDKLVALAIALVLTRQPQLNNPGIFAGKTLTVDMAQPSNWGTVS